MIGYEEFILDKSKISNARSLVFSRIAYLEKSDFISIL